MREMKDSRIPWLGEYPATWSLKKIKYCLQERIEKNNPVRTTDILSLTAKQGVIPYDQKEGGGNKPKEDVSAYRLAYPGDIVMNTRVVHVCNSTEDNRFIVYYLQHLAFQGVYKLISNGVRGNTSDFRSWDKVRDIYIALPNSRQEQQEICDYLDSVCSHVDEIVSTKKAQLSTLENYKKSLIYEYVTGKKEVK